ncbi:hypothetical protein K458DRAFT_424507 [Lentithecium fluviatile CBS 122367]|uniref:STE3-domain-containing protein n=1 Tax=Lentithecium fluviatile CBS 122367 TaxID=1168545 RepID=A0A6G1IF77_9PLEO|nr:hypothetical protein K458DRAFT_424507 [Lentithecium fluviatile CBS 122367]
MWGPIVTFVGSYYAGLLTFRLFRYRREFHRLISARNTTKSRFIRLFLMSLITVFLPYNLYILYVLASTAKDPYDWDLIHGDRWHIIPKVLTEGVVRWDRWAEIASGYIMFLFFGTGTDAHNTYKRLLCAVGLGKIFPSLYMIHEIGSSSTPSSVSFVKVFASTCASNAKGFFSKGDSVTETMASTCNESICLGTPTTNRSGHLTRIETNEPMLPQGAHIADTLSNNGYFFSRIFGHRNRQHSVLPMFATRPVDQMATLGRSPVETIPPGVHARAWASESSAADRLSSDDGVHVIHEVHQAHHKDKGARKEETYVSEWA